MALFNIS